MARAFQNLFLLVTVAVAGCDAEPVAVPTPPAPVKPTAKPATTEMGSRPTKLEMPKFEPLTEAKARGVLQAQLDQLGGDEVSRQALLYLADLGDRSGLKAVREKLLAENDGKFDDPLSAAVGAEALLAYGEADGGAVALRVAKQYAEDEFDPDDFLMHALARVQGPQRAEAVAHLVKIADGNGDDIEMNEEMASVAVEELAREAAPEARDVFVRIASNDKLGAGVRASAVAGLLNLGDPKGAELAEKLVADCTHEPTNIDVEADGVIHGFGIEGATRTVPYIQKIMDALIANDDAAMFESAEMASSIARIHAKSGGADLVPWLHEFEKKEGHEEDADITIWALGDDSTAARVADLLQGAVAAWSGPTDMSQAVEILDIAARRGVASKAPFGPIVDSAAQVAAPAESKAQGVNEHLISLNLAAAHAFLKSSK